MTRTFDGFRQKDHPEIPEDEKEIARILVTPDGTLLLRLLKKRYDLALADEATPAAMIANNAKRAVVTHLENLYAAGIGSRLDDARHRLWNYPKPTGRNEAGRKRLTSPAGGRDEG